VPGCSDISKQSSLLLEPELVLGLEPGLALEMEPGLALEMEPGLAQVLERVLALEPVLRKQPEAVNPPILQQAEHYRFFFAFLKLLIRIWLAGYITSYVISHPLHELQGNHIYFYNPQFVQVTLSSLPIGDELEF